MLQQNLILWPYVKVQIVRIEKSQETPASSVVLAPERL